MGIASGDGVSIYFAVWVIYRSSFVGESSGFSCVARFYALLIAIVFTLDWRFHVYSILA